MALRKSLTGEGELSYLQVFSDHFRWLVGAKTPGWEKFYKGRMALVTGASSGIGEMFAIKLAQRGCNLILTARSRDKLEELAAQLKKSYGIKIYVVPSDLSTVDGPKLLVNKVAEKGLAVDILVNSAAIAPYSRFEETPIETLNSLINLNISATVYLCHSYLAGMREREFGCIINLSSIGGLAPMPYMATYSSSKAFLQFFTGCLWAENRRSGVNVLCVLPGPTETPMIDSLHFEGFAFIEQRENVVERAFDALERNSNYIVTSKRTSWQIWILASLPRRLLYDISEKLFRTVYPPVAG